MSYNTTFNRVSSYLHTGALALFRQQHFINKSKIMCKVQSITTSFESASLKKFTHEMSLRFLFTCLLSATY